MARISLYFIGIFAGVTALVMFRDQAKRARRIPVQEAAARLQAAWADNHTQA